MIENLMKNTQNADSTAPAGRIGVLMLDTHFPRFDGDVGNPHTWPFNVSLHIVKGASAKGIIGSTSSQNLAPFIEAALELQDSGVCGITTSCGFLSLAQSEIASHVNVPFIASSLVQVPWLQATLPATKKVGVLTIDASALTDDHLRAAGIDSAVPVKGCEGGQEFTRSILNDATAMDRSLCKQDNVNAALALKHEHPDLGALVLECTNMAPYAADIHLATGLPVYSIYTLICWLQSGLAPRAFGHS